MKNGRKLDTNENLNFEVYKWFCLISSQNLLDSTCYLCKSRLLYFATVLILKTLTKIRLTTFLCTSSQCFSHLVHFFAIVSLFGIVHDLLSQGGVDLNTCKINYLCHLRPGNVLYPTPKKLFKREDILTWEMQTLRPQVPWNLLKVS